MNREQKRDSYMKSKIYIYRKVKYITTTAATISLGKGTTKYNNSKSTYK